MRALARRPPWPRGRARRCGREVLTSSARPTASSIASLTTSSADAGLLGIEVDSTELGAQELRGRAVGARRCSRRLAGRRSGSPPSPSRRRGHRLAEKPTSKCEAVGLHVGEGGGFGGGRVIHEAGPAACGSCWRRRAGAVFACNLGEVVAPLGVVHGRDLEETDSSARSGRATSFAQTLIASGRERLRHRRAGSRRARGGGAGRRGDPRAARATRRATGPR